MVRYTSLRENLTSILERDKALKSLQNYEKTKVKGKVGINTVYRFVDPDLGVNTPSKKRSQQKKGTLEQRTEAPLQTFIGISRKFHAKRVCFFIAFLVIKKSSFIDLFINISNLRKKIHTKTIVDVFR